LLLNVKRLKEIVLLTSGRSLRQAAGFTLVEILIVLVIISLGASVMLARIGDDDHRRDLGVEAERLHAILGIASEEAVVSNTEFGFFIDDEGYKFLVYDEKNRKWGEALVSVLKPRPLPEWLTVEYIPDEKTPSMLGTGTDKKLSADTTSLPTLMLLSSGETSIFKLRLMVVDDPDDYSIDIVANGFDAPCLIIPGKENACEKDSR